MKGREEYYFCRCVCICVCVCVNLLPEAEIIDAIGRLIVEGKVQK